MFPTPATIAPVTVLLILGAYLLGSLSGRRLLHPLRASGRSGAAVHAPADAEGWRFGAARLAFDVAKGTLAAWLALRYAPVGGALSVTGHGYLAAFAVMLGHVWPLWQGFRGGGHGATALAGGLLVLWPGGFAVAVILGSLAFLASGHVGLATVVAGLGLPLLAWWGGAEAPRLAFAIGAWLLLLLGHCAVLGRLRAGTEPRFARARLLQRWRRR